MSQTEFKLAAEKYLNKLGSSNGHKLPVSNDATTECAIEYARLKAIADYASESKIKAQRVALLSMVGDAKLTGTGKRIVHDCPQVVVEVDMRNGASRLDMTLLMNTLVKELGITPEKAALLIEKSKVAGVTTPYLSVIIK